ncbi:MAG: hypothetical protein PW734_11240 [Verrucomicrobium sp.]|nr:hypothetical protein [Verrucomicrobium sp.]
MEGQLEEIASSHDHVLIDTSIFRHRTEILERDTAYLSFLEGLVRRHPNITLTEAVHGEIAGGIDDHILGRRLEPLRQKIYDVSRAAALLRPGNWPGYEPYLKMARRLRDQRALGVGDLSPTDAEVVGHLAYVGLRDSGSVALCTSHRQLLLFTRQHFETICRRFGRPDTRQPDLHLYLLRELQHEIETFV